MRLGIYTRPYTYTLVTPNAEMPLTLAEVKAYLGINHNLSDAVLTSAIAAATHFAECFTNRILMHSIFETYRDNFPSGCGSGFEIRRSPLVSIDSITYSDPSGGVVTVDPTDYYNTKSKDYASVLLRPNKYWPLCSDVIALMDGITITFTAGMFADAASVSAAWKSALLSHVTALWANRGDCSDSACANALPPQVKQFYMCQRLMNL